MASVSDLFGIAQFVYDTTLGFTMEDSGVGPPSNAPGWVRSGAFPSARLNCSLWTSSATGQLGYAGNFTSDLFPDDTSGDGARLETRLSSVATCARSRQASHHTRVMFAFAHKASVNASRISSLSPRPPTALVEDGRTTGNGRLLPIMNSASA